MKLFKQIAFLLILGISSLNAQQLPFTFIGDKLGLPANECYNVIQDSKGYIWISTEAGLCCYNGSYCKIFDKKNGLPENCTYTLKEDTDGKIWIITSANRILIYDQGSLKEASFSKSYQSLLKGKIEQGYMLNLLDDSMVISTQSSVYTSQKNAHKVSTLSPERMDSYNFIKKENQLIYIKNPNNIKAQNNMIGFVDFSIWSGTEIKQLHIPYKTKEQLSWRVLTANNGKGEFFIAIDNILVKLNADFTYSLTELPYSIIDIYCDKNNGLWVGTIKGGVYHYSDTDSMDKKMVSLEGFSVSGICVDYEDGVWCSTLEKGVFYCINKNVESFKNTKGLDKPADLLKNEQGKLYISTGNNELIEVSNDSLLRHVLKLETNCLITDIVKEEKGFVLSGKNFVGRTDPFFQHIQYIRKHGSTFNISAIQLNRTNDKRLFFIQFGGVYEIIGNDVEFVKYPLESSGKCMYCMKNGEILYGCKDGLYHMNLKTGISKKVDGINAIVTKIIETSFGEIWIITKDNGLFSYKDEKTKNISKELQLPTDRLFDIIEDRYKTVWIASNIGLIKIKRSNGKYSSSIYNVLNGLPSDKIGNIAADSNFLYISSVEGISRLPLNAELLNNSVPKIYINRINIDNSTVTTTDSLKLSYNINSIKILVDALTFKEFNNPSIYYCLTNFNEHTFKSEFLQGKEISLDNLFPDNYKLEVYAVNNNGIKSDVPAILYFEIAKPFWKTAWFFFSCFVLLGILVFVIVKIIVSRIRKKEENKTKINKMLAEYQLSAMQAQMNPHFIFNAINSIQGYILNKDEQQAYDYLTKFSTLIRMVLNHSQEKLLPLKQELELLMLYVELEQLRFDEIFSFNLHIDEDVNVFEIQVPSMLIQPYVENAIWHGLMNLNKNKKGILTIRIELKNDLLKIIVEDNGIGRELSKTYAKETGHKSVGLKLTEERLTMINALQNYKGAKVEVNDLYDGKGIALGTRVDIFIPINY